MAMPFSSGDNALFFSEDIDDFSVEMEIYIPFVVKSRGAETAIGIFPFANGCVWH